MTTTHYATALATLAAAVAERDAARQRLAAADLAGLPDLLAAIGYRMGATEALAYGTALRAGDHAALRSVVAGFADRLHRSSAGPASTGAQTVAEVLASLVGDLGASLSVVDALASL